MFSTSAHTLRKHPLTSHTFRVPPNILRWQGMLSIDIIIIVKRHPYDRLTFHTHFIHAWMIFCAKYRKLFTLNTVNWMETVEKLDRLLEASFSYKGRTNKGSYLFHNKWQLSKIDFRADNTRAANQTLARKDRPMSLLRFSRAQKASFLLLWDVLWKRFVFIVREATNIMYEYWTLGFRLSGIVGSPIYTNKKTDWESLIKQINLGNI